MKIDIRFPFTIVKTDYLEKMEREFERCRFTIEKEKVGIEKCKEELECNYHRQARRIILESICKGCRMYVPPGEGIFGAVGKEESARWCGKCWNKKVSASKKIIGQSV